MRIRILTVGKTRNKAFRLATDEYLKRLTRYGKVKIDHVRAARTEDPDRAKDEEAAALESALHPRSTLISLDERGELWSSTDLASRIDKAMVSGDSDWTLVIGGAFGLHERIREKSRKLWSLSPLTLPHELALVVVTEQVYRAFTILRGEPYHKP